MGDGLEVSGGAAGMTASILDVKVFANVLRDAGGDLLALGPEVAKAALDDDVLAAALVCPDLLPGVLASVAAAEVGPDGVLSRGAGLATVGTLLNATAYTYEAVDAASAALLDQVQAQLGYAVGVAAPFLVAGGAAALVAATASNPALAAQLAVYAASGEIGPDLQEFLFRHPEVTEALTRMAPGLIQGSLGSLSSLLGPVGPVALYALAGGNWPTTDYESALKGLMSIGGHFGGLEDTGNFALDTKNVTVDEVNFGGVDDLFRLQSSMGAHQGDADEKVGQIRVIEVTKDGVTSLVVQVPGTEDWSLARGSNPVDFTTNVQAMSGADTVMKQKVIEAIELAQQKHPGASVMLSGHSQGGIVAASLASDPEVVRRLHIEALVTGGSPIARMPIVSGVSVLSVEHTQDPVPMLDGQANPDRTNWTTVRRDLPPADALKDGQPSAFQAHDSMNYAKTGAMIDTSEDPSVKAWRVQNEKFMGMNGPRSEGMSTTVTSTIYDIKRS